MMEQYRSIRKTLAPDTVLFFRLGDFYEMFFEDAVRASEILNITLTGREGGQAGRVPMCGIPYHSSQGYIRTLVDHNLKVAICEQVGDPKAAKGLVERKIVRIISPATFLEDETRSKDHDYMVAVVRRETDAAFACLELSTGEFWVREIASDRLLSDLSLVGPREVILPQSLSEDASFLDFLRKGLGSSVTVYEDWVFEDKEGLRHLKESFRLASEKAIGFEERPLAVSSCGAILYYLKDHLHLELDHIQQPSLISSDEFVMIERTTQKSLELTSTLSGARGSGTLVGCLDQTQTSMGSRTLYEWVTRPLLDLEGILKRQRAVAELAGNPEFLTLLRELMNGIRDMERTVSRLNYGVANARDLVNLLLFLDRVPALKEALEPASTPFLFDAAGVLNPLPEVAALIREAVVDEPPLALKDGGIIREGFNSELDELRTLATQGKSWIAEFQKKEAARTGIKNLRIKYSQVFGYTLEVGKSNLSMVPGDYIRKQTLANAERFITPELKSWDERISGARDKIKALEYDLFQQLRARILENLSELQAMARTLGSLDAAASLARVALSRSWIAPEITTDGILAIEGGRHPVVETMLPSGQFVENDALLDNGDHQLILLTGPNMAGKSTYIRQVALLCILAQMGSFVPARSARIGLVDRIFTRIGASDDLARGESTYMVEMVETANILRKATARSLLILDEVGRGTSTFDGVSIAWAICEYLARSGGRPRTLFATHYHELTQLEEHFPAIKNYKVTVRETRDNIIFLHKVVRGSSERSYGIHVARLAGIPRSVTDRAAEILGILENENSEMTQIIEGKKGKKQSDDGRQLSFFAAPVESHPLVHELENLSVDDMTPLEALNRLFEWKKRLNEKEKS